MKCNYCNEIFDGDDSILFHFHHLGENHYDVLTNEDKIMYDTRKKMIESKQEYESQKQTNGDSDLVFNSRNSKV
jgi:molybdate-binding protein